jgi:hypothetical protein
MGPSFTFLRFSLAGQPASAASLLSGEEIRPQNDCIYVIGPLAC